MKNHHLDHNSQIKLLASSGYRFTEQKTGWDSFVGLWERANLIRSFLRSQDCADDKLLLTQFLVRLRRFFAVDFCFVALFVAQEKVLEVGVPEAAMNNLPVNFARRSLDLIANSQTPISWKQLRGDVGFCSTVVSPVSPTIGQPLGLLMMGNSTPRTFSPTELFILQSLAGELSWVLRDRGSRKQYQRILATVSHELKNPLNLVVGHSIMLRERMEGRLNAEEQSQFEAIEAGAQEILDLINGFLDHSVEHEGQSVVIEQDLDLAAALEEVLAPFRDMAKAKEVGFEISYDSDLPQEIQTDPIKFKQIVRNLVRNAITFTASGSVNVRLQRKVDMIEIAVKDTGCGIDTAQLKTIFETDAEASLNQPSKGAGAVKGLGLVKEFLDLLKGHIHVRSQPGEGSEFTVCLPCGPLNGLNI
jgi:signal transduction histidine kinase